MNKWFRSILFEHKVETLNKVFLKITIECWAKITHSSSWRGKRESKGLIWKSTQLADLGEINGFCWLHGWPVSPRGNVGLGAGHRFSHLYYEGLFVALYLGSDHHFSDWWHQARKFPERKNGDLMVSTSTFLLPPDLCSSIRDQERSL